MGGGYRYYLMGLFWFRMNYRCTLLLAVGNQRESFIADVSRPLKQSGLDSSFDSGLTVVSLKKKKEKKKWTECRKRSIRSCSDRWLCAVSTTVSTSLKETRPDSPHAHFGLSPRTDELVTIRFTADSVFTGPHLTQITASGEGGPIL